MNTIFYIHGWRSTPHKKVKEIQAHYEKEKVVGIALTYRLEDDIKTLKAHINPLLGNGDNVIVCGSSMGGFMTLALMQEYPTMPFRIAFVPVNPALDVLIRMDEFLGQTIESYDGTITTTIDQTCRNQAITVQSRVRNFSPDDLASVSYHTLIGTEDEVLTYDLYRELYTDNHVTYIKSGHRLEDLKPLYKLIDGFMSSFAPAN